MCYWSNFLKKYSNETYKTYECIECYEIDHFEFAISLIPISGGLCNWLQYDLVSSSWYL